MITMFSSHDLLSPSQRIVTTPDSVWGNTGEIIQETPTSQSHQVTSSHPPPLPGLSSNISHFCPHLGPLFGHLFKHLLTLTGYILASGGYVMIISTLLQPHGFVGHKMRNYFIYQGILNKYNFEK